MATIVIPSRNKFFPTKSFKTGDTILIKKYVGRVLSNFGYSEGAIKKNPSLADKKKEVERFIVEYKGEDYQLDPNGTSLGLLGAKWGDKSENWEGKEAVGEVLRQATGINMIEFKPLEWKD